MLVGQNSWKYTVRKKFIVHFLGNIQEGYILERELCSQVVQDPILGALDANFKIHDGEFQLPIFEDQQGFKS